MRQFYHWRYSRVNAYLKDPLSFQNTWFKRLMQQAAGTEWGKLYDYASIKSFEQYSAQVPVQDYETLKPLFHRMMLGERDVLWPGRVAQFSKSSGTTNDKSKFIPVSVENLRTCHLRGGWDAMTLYYTQRPDARIFEGKSFLVIGNWHQYPEYPSTIFGDVSAIMTRNLPYVARPFFTPSFDAVFQDDWESKIEMMTRAAIDPKQRHLIRMIGGVPTWTLVFFRHILERTGAKNILDVWPNFELYFHGGVSLEPYKTQLNALLPDPKVWYKEVYNASEGYFGVQLEAGQPDMTFLLDNGVYYEFVPMEEWHKEQPNCIPLEGVEAGKNYAVVISTNAGLWRYMLGDTVRFTSVKPYLFQITGRTKQFVNAFGEEIMVANTDQAIAATCQAMDAVVNEYTVAPIYFSSNNKGGHEWLIEFEKEPTDIHRFNQLLDENLQKVNSDYEAKRYKNMALLPLKLKQIPRGTFLKWLSAKGKLGGQHKVPRLSNHRKFVEEILSFLQESRV